MNIITYYCFIPISAKELIKKYIADWKEKNENREIIITAAKYQNNYTDVYDSINQNIIEQSNLLGFCLKADILDINQNVLDLIVKIGGNVFDNVEAYTEFINAL